MDRIHMHKNCLQNSIRALRLNFGLPNKKPEKSGRTLSGFRTVAIWEERYVTPYMLRRSIKSRVTLRKDYLIKLHAADLTSYMMKINDK